MSGCKLTKSFEITDCNSLQPGGVTGVVYLINFDDLLKGTIVHEGGIASNVVQSIALPEGTKMVRYGLSMTSTVPTPELVRNEGGRNGYKHSVVFYMPNLTQDVRTEMNKLLNFSKCAAIVMLNSKEIADLYGLNCGLVLTGFEENNTDAAVSGGVKVTLSTPESGLEALPGHFVKAVQKGDETVRAATVAMLDGLSTLEKY